MSATRRDLERLLEASYRTVVGRDLRTDAGGDPYDAPAALLMHGNEADPVFCYANRTAQGLWGLTRDEFIRLPSRLSAEPPVQAERDRLLARVRAHGFIDDYQGVRIAKDGTRFRISSAVVWMVAVEGAMHGQAALFRDWAPELSSKTWTGL
ncbi:MAG: MEKHLA domain-containing protein [Candidatus Binatota bacterium]|nr:MEKHLA domain-containing protein [Candidatus Binatota bacterium]